MCRKMRQVGSRSTEIVGHVSQKISAALQKISAACTSFSTKGMKVSDVSSLVTDDIQEILYKEARLGKVS